MKDGNGVPIARAIRGPVTLITIGVLFALNNFTPYGFEQTWPVLLIVFGLLSLLRRSTEPPRMTPPLPPYNPQGANPGPAWTGSYRQSSYQAPGGSTGATPADDAPGNAETPQSSTGGTV